MLALFALFSLSSAFFLQSGATTQVSAEFTTGSCVNNICHFKGFDTTSCDKSDVLLWYSTVNPATGAETGAISSADGQFGYNFTSAYLGPPHHPKMAAANVAALGGQFLINGGYGEPSITSMQGILGGTAVVAMRANGQDYDIKSITLTGIIFG